jgi:hypothetical protein
MKSIFKKYNEILTEVRRKELEIRCICQIKRVFKKRNKKFGSELEDRFGKQIK